MSNFELRHPDLRHPEFRHPGDGLLLQYLDGELPKRQSRKIQHHLQACWQCRADLETLETTVNDCVRYRKLAMAESLPPAAWGGLDFERVDAELAAESLLARLGRWFSPRHSAPLRWAISGAMALALTVAIVHKLRETPNVEAAVLLHKAIAASETRPPSVRRLRITTPTRQVTRTIGKSGAASVRPATSVLPAAGEAEIAHLFEAAHYDWNDPLSAKAYAAWHDALVQKLDEVATADPNTYKIKTTTADGELISATLKLRKSDYAPLEGRFEFRNREWVEMTELVDQHEIPASTVAGTTGGMPRQPGVPPGPSLLAPDGNNAAGEPVSVNEELQVVAALHQLGADLGEPIEVTREGRDVVVSGTAIAPARQQQIHAALDRLPHVAVRFSDPAFRSGFPASTPAHSEPAPARDAAAVEKSKYQARIEQRLGGRPQFERFSGQLLDWTDSAMARAYALRRLAQQFPQEAESRMSAQDRRTLRSLGGEHLAALQKDLNKIQTTLNPVLTGMGGTPAGTASDPVAGGWQNASEQLLASARLVETLQAIVLGVTAAGSSDDVPSQLLTAARQLTSDIEQCQRLLSRD